MQPSIGIICTFGSIYWNECPKTCFTPGIVIIAQPKTGSWLTKLLMIFSSFLVFILKIELLVSLFPFWQKHWQVLICHLKHCSYLGTWSANLKYKFLLRTFFVNVVNLTQICQILYPQNTTDFFGNRIKYLHFFQSIFHLKSAARMKYTYKPLMWETSKLM